MKSIKLFILLFVLFAVPNYAQTSTPTPVKEIVPAQTTISDISDSEFEDVQMVISGTFPERRLVGKVVGVHDGDTATVLDADKRQYKFRFNGIDAPELKMDFGNKSKKNLSDWIFGKEVTVLYSKIDKYGRFVGTIFVNGVDVNLEQIKAGLAWHYKKYADEQSEKDRKAYAEAETAAKEAKKGLWLQPNSTPPWEYRASLKVKQEENRATRTYFSGAKGGCYYLNTSGNKSYVDKKFCVNAPANVTELKVDIPKPTEPKPMTGKLAEEKALEEKPTEEKPIEKKQAEDKTTITITKESTEKKTDKKTETGGKTYIRGSRGGCYYLNESGKKVYVKDKTLCQ